MKTSEKSTGRGLGKNIILLVVSLILFLIVLEAIFRIFNLGAGDDEFFFNILASISSEGNLAVAQGGDSCFEVDELLFWKMRKNLDNCEWDPIGKEYITTNNHGLRDQDCSLVKPPNSYRILALGDSVTYGLRVPVEDTFSSFLEEEFKRDPEFHQDVEVINAGVPGYSSYQGLLYFQEEGLAFDPDLVIVSFGYNDSRPSKSADSNVGKLKRSSVAWASLSSRFLDFLCQKSAFVRSLNYFIYRYVIQRGFDNKRVPEDEYQKNLEKIIKLARENGVKVILLAPPFRRVVDLSKYVDKMRYVARRNKVPFVFDTIFTVEFTEENPTLFADDAHPNANGHARITEMLLNIIKPE